MKSAPVCALRKASSQMIDSMSRWAHLPAAGQRADVAVDTLVVEPESVQHFARLALEGIPAEVGVLLLHFAEAFENAVHVGGACRVGHGELQRFQLVMQIAQTSAAGNGLVEHRASAHFLHVLAEVPDREFLRDRDLAFVRGFFADDHAEQRRLAGAVGPDQAHLVARVDLEGGVDEQHLPAVLLADVREGNHKRPSYYW
jgi:hypothetical protein